MHYRKIMENYLGRKLSRKEFVHHRDENRRNNSIENLLVMSASEHSSLHMSGRILPESTKIKLQLSSRRARPGAKLDIADIPTIRLMLRDGIKQRIIAFAYGVNRRTISAVNTKAIWPWV